MAQVACDICEQENGAQMMTNLDTGETIAVGAGCSLMFYWQLLAGAAGAGEHKGLPQKCQACRRIHEQITLLMRPAAADAGPAGIRDQPGPGGHDQAAADADEAAEAALEAERQAAGGE